MERLVCTPVACRITVRFYVAELGLFEYFNYLRKLGPKSEFRIGHKTRLTEEKRGLINKKGFIEISHRIILKTIIRTRFVWMPAIEVAAAAAANYRRVLPATRWPLHVSEFEIQIDCRLERESWEPLQEPLSAIESFGLKVNRFSRTKWGDRFRLKRAIPAIIPKQIILKTMTLVVLN